MTLEASGRWYLEDQKFKGSLGQMSNLRPTYLKTHTQKCSHEIPTLALASQALLNPKICNTYQVLLGNICVL